MSTAWRNGVIVLFIVSFLFVLNSNPVSALPTLPDPELCQVEPRTAENVDDLTSNSPPERSDADEIEWGGARGASEEEVEAIADLFRSFFACHNIGDYLRQVALLTDDALARGFVSEVKLEPPDELKIRFEGVYAAYMFADGRLGAVVVGSTPAEFSPLQSIFFFLELVNGRWLIDDIPPSGVIVRSPT
jgi:hypothetical protein